MGNCLIVRKGSQPEGTATPSQVLSGATFQSANSDDLQTGTMTNYGTSPQGESTVFYNNNIYIRTPDNGNGYVEFEMYRPITDFGACTQAEVLSGKTFTSSAGLNKSGTMTNNGNVSVTLSAGGSYTIPWGFHGGSGKVKAKAMNAEIIGTGTVTTSRDYVAIAIVRASSQKRNTVSIASLSIGATKLAERQVGQYGYNSGFKADSDFTTNLCIYGPLASGSTITVGSVDNGWGLTVIIGLY